MTVSRKKAEKDKEQTKQDVEVSVKGIKQPELPVFEGVIAKFEDWEVVFDAFIGTSRIDPKLKMLYLKNSLSGEALKLVEGYKPSEMGYAKAREALTDKYGGKTRRIRHGLNDIRQFSNIAEGDTRRLEQYADKCPRVEGRTRSPCPRRLPWPVNDPADLDPTRSASAYLRTEPPF
ncbi:hypothetical protein FJT64_021472 [Amphibalanus amphitrite]|uniref:Uncharacterized protein n=1 Tax=Amphibalanus amphitrite TaxID=1232801 RepID=A0A6A4WYH3_AMPAM|nr:hypothetical protein FJT64_021472 [Amphibalanus amphitrite]